MITNNLLLAAFIATQNVPVKKIAEETFSFDLEETNVLVQQFSAPDGYNTNIHKLDEKMGELAGSEIYVEPAPEEGFAQ